MFPPLTDFVALFGLDLVLCAGCLRLLSVSGLDIRWKKAITLVCFFLLWFPVGGAHLPVLAYIRGVSSDLSITLVVLACLGLSQRLFGRCVQHSRERTAVLAVVAVAAMFLYPLALGWGDWDAYRPGWGSSGMWAILLLMSLLAWAWGLRLLPTLVGLALLAWTAGVLESTNLWDYLMDPWLAIFAIFHCARLGIKKLSGRLGPTVSRLPSQSTQA
jgi:hypothetical protein